MRTRTSAALSVATASCVAFGAFATSGSGDRPRSTVPGGGHYKEVTAALEPAAARSFATEAGSRRRPPREPRKPKRPQITNLITVDPVPIAAASTVVVRLRCRRALGVPLSGGGIAPPAPASVAIAVDSRFDPRTLTAPRRVYFVGARNFGDQPAEFNATLACGKRIEER